MKKLLFGAAMLLTLSASAQNNAITGIVYGDSVNSTQVDTFMVWLITFDAQTNILQAVDSQVVSGQGMAQYSFSNNPAQGSYRTKAAHLNGPSSGTGLLPTYHHTSYMNTPILWSNASVINHPGNTVTWGKHIYMATGTVTTGPGFVGGNVSQGANKGTGSGIAGMNVYLLDANDEPFIYTTTDANGDYSFSNLPFGTYKVMPENLGDATTAASITIDANNTSVNDIHFERSNTNNTIKPKETGIEEFNTQSTFAVYPNPANGMVNIKWGNAANTEANIVITDLSGKVVYNTLTNMSNSVSIDMQSVTPGLYFLSVITENNKTTQKLTVQ